MSLRSAPLCHCEGAQATEAISHLYQMGLLRGVYPECNRGTHNDKKSSLSQCL